MTLFLFKHDYKFLTRSTIFVISAAKLLLFTVPDASKEKTAAGSSGGGRKTLSNANDRGSPGRETGTGMRRADRPGHGSSFGSPPEAIYLSSRSRATP